MKELREAELERDISSMTPIITNIVLENLRDLDMEEVKKEMGGVLAELIICENSEIRRLLQELLREMLLKPSE
jgi:hypothetical protein